MFPDFYQSFICKNAVKPSGHSKIEINISPADHQFIDITNLVHYLFFKQEGRHKKNKPFLFEHGQKSIAYKQIFKFRRKGLIIPEVYAIARNEINFRMRIQKSELKFQFVLAPKII